MSKVLIKSSTLTDIANAIRAKDGSTAQMYPSEMAGKIGAIEKAPEKTKVTIVGYSELFKWGSGIAYDGKVDEFTLVREGNVSKTIEVTVGSIVFVGYYTDGIFSVTTSHDYELRSATPNLQMLTGETDGIMFYAKAKNPDGDTLNFRVRD